MTQQMILHKHYDRKLGKYISAMVPQSKEHKERNTSINKALTNAKEPNKEEIHKHNQGGFHKHGKFHRNRAYSE